MSERMPDVAKVMQRVLDRKTRYPIGHVLVVFDPGGQVEDVYGPYSQKEMAEEDVEQVMQNGRTWTVFELLLPGHAKLPTYVPPEPTGDTQGSEKCSD